MLGARPQGRLGIPPTVDAGGNANSPHRSQGQMSQSGTRGHISAIPDNVVMVMRYC